MNASRWFYVAVIISAVFAVGTWSSRAEEQGGKSATEKEMERFKPKYVAVELDRALDQHATWVIEPRVQTLGGESFLVGKLFSVSDEGKDEVGVGVWISIHHITEIYTYETAEELRKTWEKSDK